jgi:hypothetical protein
VQPVTTTVTGGATPLISWTPACRAFRLRVEALPSVGFGEYRIYWEVFSPAGNITPGVRYGAVPNGASETAPVQPLTSGRIIEYMLTDSIGVLVGGGSQVAP